MYFAFKCHKRKKRKSLFPRKKKQKYHQIYEIARDSFIEQLNRIESLEKKAQINLVIIGIVLGFGLFKPELISDLVSKINFQYFVNSFQLLSLAISFLFFILSLVFCILALLPRDFQVYPDIVELSKKFENKKIEDLDASMSNFFQKIINENEKYLKSKTKHLKRSIMCILIAFPLCAVFIILTAATKILTP